jgi:hexaprenyl-diphosphate synthase
MIYRQNFPRPGKLRPLGQFIHSPPPVAGPRQFHLEIQPDLRNLYTTATMSRTARLATSIAPRASTPRIATCPFSSSAFRSREAQDPTPNHSAQQGSKLSWKTLAATAQHLKSKPAADAPLKMDPFQTVAREMKFLTGNIRSLLGSGHPTLDTVAKYYTQSEGKYVRPALVLLMSRATALTPKVGRNVEGNKVDTPITDSSILVDENPDANAAIASSLRHDAAYTAEDSDILPPQRRLAEITELIHTASLMHDDVIDHSESRRSAPSANIEFGNKMAVLAGDFLLGRASVALARLRDPEVTELLATVIANLVEGEFMQLKNTAADEKNPVFTEDTISYYLQKTYLKSASLISKSCRRG